MTRNQIAYQEHLETQRSNLARELEQARHNRATEGQAVSELSELNRSNLAKELNATGQLRETQRAHLEDERIRQILGNLNYETATDVARINAAASRYAAMLNSNASKFNAVQNTTAQREIASAERDLRRELGEAGLTQDALNSVINALSGLASAYIKSGS